MLISRECSIWKWISSKMSIYYRFNHQNKMTFVKYEAFAYRFVSESAITFYDKINLICINKCFRLSLINLFTMYKYHLWIEKNTVASSLGTKHTWFSTGIHHLRKQPRRYKPLKLALVNYMYITKAGWISISPYVDKINNLV